MSAPGAVPTDRWKAAWPDALAFGGGLGLAWWLDWEAADLVWSLWLSSLVLGYALIVWRLSEPVRETVQAFVADRGELAGPWAKAVVLTINVLGALLGTVFFTAHFGGFHFVHSVFLNVFFPVFPEVNDRWVNAGLYLEVLQRYWWYLPIAAIGERAAFFPRTAEVVRNDNDGVTEPYKNVMRMHLLIFFFAFAHFARVEHFAVYAAIYAVYFFPWRLLRP